MMGTPTPPRAQWLAAAAVLLAVQLVGAQPPINMSMFANTCNLTTPFQPILCISCIETFNTPRPLDLMRFIKSNAPNRTAWAIVAKLFWDTLETFDSELRCQDEFYAQPGDPSNGQCPCPLGVWEADNSAPINGSYCEQQQNRAKRPGCGLAARKMVRTMFHDAGTYDKYTNTGGLDGSIFFEQNRTENKDLGLRLLLDLLITRQVRGSLRRPPLSFQVPPNFTPSNSDIIVLGSHLSLFRCGGPIIKFMPGRVDATVANAAGLLPDDKMIRNLNELVNIMDRMSLSKQDTIVAIAAGHTISKVQGVPLDSTPRVFDNLYFKQLLDKTAPRFVRTDLMMLDNKDMKRYIKQLALDSDTFMIETARVLDKMSWLGQARPSGDQVDYDLPPALGWWA